MDGWIRIGSRYINLANVTEVRIQDRPRQARAFFIGGGMLELDEDDTPTLDSYLQENVELARPARRTVSAPRQHS